MRSVRRWSQAGFTLLELLVVVAILAIVAGGLLVAYDNLDDKAAEGVSAHTLASLDSAVRNYTVVARQSPNYLDAIIAADYPADPLDPTRGALSNPEIVALFSRPDKVSVMSLSAAQVSALNAAGITHLRYVDIKGNDPANPAPDSGLTVTLDAPTHDGTPGVVGPLLNIDIASRIHETPRPGGGRNRGRGFEAILVAGDPVLLWDANRSGGTGGYDNIKLGAGPDDVIVILGLGNDASIVGARSGDVGLSSAPVYGKIRNGPYDYVRYLVAYNLGPATAPFGKAVLQVVMNSHGDFVDEMIAEHSGQKS